MTKMITVRRQRIVHYEETVEACPKCEGKKKVYMHDPSGDGHGGLNGGSWGWFTCSCGDGTKKGYDAHVEREKHAGDLF